MIQGTLPLSSDERKFQLTLVGDREHRTTLEPLIDECYLTDFVTATSWLGKWPPRKRGDSSCPSCRVSPKAELSSSLKQGLWIGLFSAHIMRASPSLSSRGQTRWIFTTGSEKDYWTRSAHVSMPPGRDSPRDGRVDARVGIRKAESGHRALSISPLHRQGKQCLRHW